MQNNSNPRAYLLIIIALMFSLASCAEVKPWQRNILAQEGMQLVPDVMQNYADTHIYFSKEASTGGQSIGGGGCGCN